VATHLRKPGKVREFNSGQGKVRKNVFLYAQNLVHWFSGTAMLNYACEAGEAGKVGDGNTAAFTAGGAAKMTRAVR